MRELFGRRLAIGIEGQGPEAPILDGAVTTVTEVDEVDGPIIDRRRYGGLMVKLPAIHRPGRGLFIGLRDAGMAFPSRLRPSFLALRVKLALGRRLASDVGAELVFCPRGAEALPSVEIGSGQPGPNGCSFRSDAPFYEMLEAEDRELEGGAWERVTTFREVFDHRPGLRVVQDELAPGPTAEQLGHLDGDSGGVHG